MRVSFVDSGGNGNIDPGETIRVRIPLENYTVNELSASRALAVRASLVSETPGVEVIQPLGIYATIDSGETDQSTLDYVLRISPSFDPGTPIDLRLKAFGIFARQVFATAELRHTLFTGTPSPTSLLTENFNAVAPGTLPTGWAVAHGGGINTVPWTTNNTFCGNTTNAAFHINANDGPGGTGNPTRFERLFSPTFAVPSDSDYVTIEFDVCYDTEEDPNFNVLAYDGFLLRILDATPGNLLRSVLVEAYADEFTTGSIKHYPRHFPRSGSTAYFQDMSAWAGDSGADAARSHAPARHGWNGCATALRIHAGWFRDLYQSRIGPRSGLRCVGRQYCRE